MSSVALAPRHSKKELGPIFGEIAVNLDAFPREITLEIDESQVDTLRNTLHFLGYLLSTDKLGLVGHTTAKVKSFVSCAVGKIEGEEC